jgi:hypothetical protein
MENPCVPVLSDEQMSESCRTRVGLDARSAGAGERVGWAVEGRLGPRSRRGRDGARLQTDGQRSRGRAETRGDGRREKKKWTMGITNTQKSMVLLGRSQSSPSDESGVESCVRRLNPSSTWQLPTWSARRCCVKHQTSSLSVAPARYLDLT